MNIHTQAYYLWRQRTQREHSWTPASLKSKKTNVQTHQKRGGVRDHSKSPKEKIKTKTGNGRGAGRKREGCIEAIIY
jgi:hypothetical protein